jgi:RNase P/RNase MRP subunit p30
MKIKISEVLKNYDGSDIINDNTPKTLRDVCITSLLSPLQEDDEKKKLEKYEIFKLLRDEKHEVTLTAEQISIIKRAVGKFQPQLIMGQCFELLEK